MRYLKASFVFGFFFFIFSFFPGEGCAQVNSWTHFRGSRLDGISDEKVIPVSWNDSTNVLWKVPVEGKGWSSPVVYGNQVWITTAAADGKEMKGLCFDLNTGKELFNISLFKPEAIQKKHAINTYATPTSCIEKGFVYITFGTYGTTCLSTVDGSIQWKRTDLNCEHVQGSGSSLFIYKNLLIVHCEGTDQQYIVGLDKATGKTVWRVDRPKELYDKLLPIGKKAYITPVVINVKGRDLLISNGSAVCMAYDPLTGEEVWRVVQGEDSTISMPFAENGMIYFFTAFVTPPQGEKYCELMAVNPDGKGDITATHVLWRHKSPILQLLTPLIKDGLIYFVDTENKLLCLDAKDGGIVYSSQMKAKYNSSPVYAAGNIYFTSVKGETMVIKSGRELKIIAENILPGQVYATPAMVDRSILIRTEGFLYRIGKR